MTNYERICADKAFCAYVIASDEEYTTVDRVMKWLDEEQTEVAHDDQFYTLRWIKNKLNEPAPNPFTPDQLAWMREEQRAGYNYAAKDCNGYVYIHTSFPKRLDYTWDSISNKKTSAQRMFLSNVLSWNDPEPLCFADYAPLEVNHE